MTESGFGSDMGMEKFFDIVCRSGGLRPNAVVLVATVKALKHHGGDPDGGLDAVERGSANMRRHLEIVRAFGLNAVVAVNRFPGDTQAEVEAVRSLARDYGAFAAEVNGGFEEGGRGAAAWPRPPSPRPTPTARSATRTSSTRTSSRRSTRSRQGLRRGRDFLTRRA